MTPSYFLYRFKYRFGRSLPLRKPVDIALELSSACNMKCSYCYHAEDKKDLSWKPRLMDRKIASRILYDAAQLKVPSVKFNWRGESTLNPNFSLITGLAKRLSEVHKGAFIDRISNTNMQFDSDREDIFQGLKNLTKVKVSFDSFNPIIFNKQREKGDWYTVRKNIDTFYDMPGRKTKIVIQAIRTKLNHDEKFEYLMQRYWPSAELSVRDVVEGRNEKDLTDIAIKKRDINNRQACFQAFTRLIFNSQGTATICCPDIHERLYLDNIGKRTVEEIFNCSKAKAIRKMLKKGTAFECVDTCKNCSSFESYKGYKPNWDS